MGMKETWRKMRFGEPIVVVSGLPRSGTSMAMKMLDAVGMGVVQDNIRTADEDNPKGYFEDERIKDLEGMEDKSWVRDARGKAIKCISFLLKDLPEDNNYKVILMRRNLDEVLASQQKMLDRRGEDNDIEDDRMFDLWNNHLWRVKYLLDNNPQFEWIEVFYSDVLADPASQAKRIAEFLGGLDAEKMASVVDNKLYRNRSEAS